MTRGLERAWVYGCYVAYWQYNFVEDERANSREAYDQIMAETLGYA